MLRGPRSLNVLDVIDTHCKQRGGATAVIDASSSLSYAGLVDLALRVAGGR
jgi:hypothetical protein